MSGPGGADLTGTMAGLMSGLVSIPVFIAANAVFVAAEFALVAVRRTRVREMVQQGVKGARLVERATGDLDRYIAATQLGITLSSIGLGWLGQPAMARLLLPVFESLGPRLSAVAANSLSLGIAFASISFLHVVLGELAPKTIALQRPDRVALWSAPPLRVFEVLFRPFIWALNSVGNALVRLIGFRPARGPVGQVHSVTELTLLVDASAQAGVLERQEREMMRGVLAFGDLTVDQVMTPRSAIVGVNQKDSAATIVQAALESGYSRLPVYESGPDDIVGVLHVKDLLSLYSEFERDVVVIQDLLRQPYFVRAGIRVLDLMREFQRGENHVAFVLDDFGELIGLATLEDLLEEIVGEIKDEHDAAGGDMKLERDGSFILPGRASTRDALNDLGISAPLWASGSIGDFLEQVRGGSLSKGDVVRHEDLEFSVLEIDGEGGVARVRVVKGSG